MNLIGKSWWELFSEAVRCRFEVRGDSFEFCSIINAKSGICNGGCGFCAQAYPSKTKAPVYPLVGVDEMLKGAVEAKKNGAIRYSIVTSGRSLGESEIGIVAEAVGRIKREVGIEVDVSLGIIPDEFIEELKAAGVRRIHHNLESSERFYPLITDRIDWREKFRFCERVKEHGLELCCGGLFGLGEGEEDWKLLADALESLEVDSIPLNFLIPIPGTPLGGERRLSPVDCIKIASYFRLRFPKAELRVCGGREYNLGQLQALLPLVVDGFMVGGYLTRPGRDPALDRELIESLGLRLAGL